MTGRGSTAGRRFPNIYETTRVSKQQDLGHLRTTVSSAVRLYRLATNAVCLSTYMAFSPFEPRVSFVKHAMDLLSTLRGSTRTCESAAEVQLPGSLEGDI